MAHFRSLDYCSLLTEDACDDEDERPYNFEFNRIDVEDSKCGHGSAKQRLAQIAIKTLRLERIFFDYLEGK
jgi:hypothetical protein